MKKFTLLAVFLLAFFSFAPSALALDAPEVDEPPSPVNADVIEITGTANANAKIVVTGGPYEMPPFYADASGNWSVTVSLIQETTNLFFFSVQTETEQSESVEVSIVESDELAEEYEQGGGGDHTAPAEPVLDESEVEVDELTYTITGSGEAGTSIFVNGEDSNENVASNGDLEVTVTLSGSGTRDKFSIALKDAAGNLSSTAIIYVTSDLELSEVLTDISGHWAEDYILELYSEDVVSGYPDETFRPDNSILRAEILKIALEAFNEDLTTNGNLDAFSDVDSDDWFYPYVEFAYESEVVEGYEDGTFRPGVNVDRAAALKIILEAAGIEEFGTYNNEFADVDSDDWYANYVGFAVENGFVSGYEEDGLFHAERNMSRAEVCKVVNLVMDYLAAL